MDLDYINLYSGLEISIHNKIQFYEKILFYKTYQFTIDNHIFLDSQEYGFKFLNFNGYISNSIEFLQIQNSIHRYNSLNKIIYNSDNIAEIKNSVAYNIYYICNDNLINNPLRNLLINQIYKFASFRISNILNFYTIIENTIYNGNFTISDYNLSKDKLVFYHSLDNLYYDPDSLFKPFSSSSSFSSSSFSDLEDSYNTLLPDIKPLKNIDLLAISKKSGFGI